MSTLNNSYQPQDPARRYRGVAFVVGLHLLLAWAVISGTAQKTLDAIKRPLEAVVIQEVIIPPPAQPPTPKVRTPEPLAPKPPAVQQATPNLPQPSAARPPEYTPEVNAPIASKTSAAAAAVTATAAIATAAATTAPPKPEPSQRQTASLESEYLGRVRAMLNATKRYPTGRQASQQRPSGAVKVWFILLRNGTLVDVGVITSSDSNLLDDAALSSVRRGSYPAFPAATWPGQEQHKFSADIDFSPASGG